MARRRSKSLRPGPAWGRWTAWLGVALVGAALGWLWWRAAHPPSAVAGREATPAVALDESPAESPAGSDPRAPAAPEVEPEPDRRPPGDAGTPGVVAPRVVLAPTNPPPTLLPPGAPGSGAVKTGAPPAVAKGSRSRLGTEQAMAVQVALSARGFSCGSIDGVIGSQTRAALRVFQRTEGLAVTGEADAATLRRLASPGPALTEYTVTAEDLERLTPVPSSWLGKSARERLDYETVLELVAERAQAHPRLIRQLNPQVDWFNVSTGAVVAVPRARLPPPRGKAGSIHISLSEKALRVLDSRSNLMAYFPCSIARKVEKRPVGVLRVARLAPNPNYRFDPEIFAESPEARRIGRRLMIPPGPNNPVGAAWIGLDRPGYGIHGTPRPEEVGRTESHGCFRLANWNAEHLLQLAWVGLPVYVDP